MERKEEVVERVDLSSPGWEVGGGLLLPLPWWWRWGWRGQVEGGGGTDKEEKEEAKEGEEDEDGSSRGSSLFSSSVFSPPPPPTSSLLLLLPTTVTLLRRWSKRAVRRSPIPFQRAAWVGGWVGGLGWVENWEGGHRDQSTRREKVGGWVGGWVDLPLSRPSKPPPSFPAPTATGGFLGGGE